MSPARELIVAVVAGGPSAEAAVSRTSARAACDALAAKGHRAALLELDQQLPTALISGGYDVVLPLTHGPLGEDGCLQGLLEVLAMPYVGSGVIASALGMSKPHAKSAFRAAKLPVSADQLVARGEALVDRAKAIRARLGRAVVVKPAAGGSAIGVTIIEITHPTPYSSPRLNAPSPSTRTRS